MNQAFGCELRIFSIDLPEKSLNAHILSLLLTGFYLGLASFEVYLKNLV